ncbi:MAG: DUF502 domain-containing protein [Halobacteria archaeon]|nr:DUF502 domain-containing protein [Halobacteria archaeon]
MATKDWLKKNLVSGVVVLAPLAATLYVVVWFYNKVTSLPGIRDLEVTRFGAVNDLLKFVVAVGVVVAVLAVVGNLIRSAVGVFVQKSVDDLVNRIPGLRLIYNATKLAIETIFGETGEFQEPVKLDVQGLRLTAFRTGNKTEDGRDVIFLPTAPNITTGFVIEIDDERLEETDETVEKALTRILSAGFGDTDSDAEEGVSGLFGVNEEGEEGAKETEE